MRVKDWDKALAAVIRKHQALPSQYGVSDCYLIPADAVAAITGQPMYEGIEYDSPMGAAKCLLAHGFKDVAEAFAAKFETVHPLQAQRGDIGVVENEKGEVCGGLFTSIGFMTRTDEGVIFLPHSKIKTAFKVGR
jgi:hypothetical protein